MCWKTTFFVELQGLGLKLGVDLTFAGNNHNNHNHKNDNPHLSLVKGTVQGHKEQGVGIRDIGEKNWYQYRYVCYLLHRIGIVMVKSFKIG